MPTFVLIHGGGASGASLDPLSDELRSRGHAVIAPDLPSDREDGDLSVCAQHVVDTARGADDIVVVGHSYGGLTAPLTCEPLDAKLLVLMSAMIPAPGETAGEWWDGSGFTAAMDGVDLSDEQSTYYHDVPADVAARDATTVRDQTAASYEQPWPLDAWPAVPTRVLAFADDRFMPVEFQRELARTRLGLDDIDTTPGGHLAYLSRTSELADALDRLARETGV